jgi:hypothetical protein
MHGGGQGQTIKTTSDADQIKDEIGFGLEFGHGTHNSANSLHKLPCEGDELGSERTRWPGEGLMFPISGAMVACAWGAIGEMSA